MFYGTDTSLLHPPARHHDSLRLVFGYVVILALSITLLAFYWFGYRGYHDEIFLIRGTLGWLEDFPYVGSTHWELRHPYVLATAASIKALGVSEWALLLPNVLALLSLLTVIYWVTARWLGTAAAVLAGLAFCTTPLAVEATTSLMPDVFEALFVVASLSIFLAASNRERPGPLLLVAGVFAGLAFLTRETSVLLVVFYVLLFLVGVRVSRGQYFWLLAGFLPIWLLEVSYLAVQTGDPFYRYVIDMVQYHPPTDFDLLTPSFVNPSEVQFAYDRLAGMHSMSSGGGDARSPGPVEFGSVLNPIAFLFVNHEYGLFWFLAFPALVWGLMGWRKSSSERRLVAAIAVFSIVWFVGIAYGLGVRPLPRYFLPAMLAASVVAAFFLVWLWQIKKKGVIVGGAAAALLAGNLLATDLRSPRAYAERAYLDYALDHPEVVITSPTVAKTVRELAQLRQQEVSVKAVPPERGDTFLYIPRRYGGDENVKDIYLPEQEWEDIKIFRQRERVAGRIIRWLRLDTVLPGGITQKLRFPEPTGRLMRVR